MFNCLASVGGSGLRRVLATSVAIMLPSAAFAQSGVTLPAVTVMAAQPDKPQLKPAMRSTPRSNQAVRHAQAPSQAAAPAAVPGSLTVLTAQQALRESNRRPAASR
jgi:iron complex outermembrane receptor protein